MASRFLVQFENENLLMGNATLSLETARSMLKIKLEALTRPCGHADIILICTKKSLK